MWGVGRRRVSGSVRKAVPRDEGREVEMLRRMKGSEGISLMLSRDLMEPGILGICGPVLIWPKHVGTAAERAHMEAIWRMR